MDKNQLSPLMLAASNGKTEVVKYLLKLGADASLKNVDGMTSLHLAAKAGYVNVCELILNGWKQSKFIGT